MKAIHIIFGYLKMLWSQNSHILIVSITRSLKI